jgi:hypothetical protein
MTSHERCERRCQSGSALLLVVGATAAISALSLALLTAPLLAYELATLEYEGAQARIMARSALDLVRRELATGRVAMPAAGAPVLWQSAAPPVPPGMPALPPGCGFQVRLTPVRGPAGTQQWRSGAAPASLVDAVAEGRCGRGYNSVGGRFAVATGGSVVRLY